MGEEYVLFFPRRKKSTKRTPLKDGKVSKNQNASLFDFFQHLPLFKKPPSLSASRTSIKLSISFVRFSGQVREILKRERMSQRIKMRLVCVFIRKTPRPLMRRFFCNFSCRWWQEKLVKHPYKSKFETTSILSCRIPKRDDNVIPFWYNNSINNLPSVIQQLQTQFDHFSKHINWKAGFYGLQAQRITQ